MKKKISELMSTIKWQEISLLRSISLVIRKTLLFNIGLFLFWLFFIHYNNTHHVSISRNFFTGEIILDSSKGIKLSPAWVQVIKFDTRPIKVCIDCSCSNINCKLIAFNPKGWQEFINREGFKYFWFKNRLSINFGQEYEYRGIKHVLRGYAYDGEYNFITELELVE